MFFSISDDIFIEKIGDEIVILNEESGEYFGIDGVGLDIWNLISKKNSLEDIVEFISNRYGIDRDTAYRDSIEFIDALLRHGLIFQSE